MDYRNDNETTNKYWRRLWHILLAILEPFLFIISLFTRREMHSTSYLWALLKSKWYHWRCELPAGRFIFTLYFCIIATGTTLLVLSQFHDWYFAPVTAPELFAKQLARWPIDVELSGAANLGFFDFLAWCWHNFLEEANYFLYNAKLGPINMHNWNILVDAMFTATSATCLTGMTSTDITKYPPVIIISLVLAGAASITVLALSFNINSFFYSESTSHAAISLEEYSEGHHLGKFTLKAMYGVIVLGIIAITLYFLPPTSVNNFLHSQLALLTTNITQNFLYILVWLAIVSLVILYIYREWNSLKGYVYKFFTLDSVYYATITSVLLAIMFWLYYAEGHWEIMDFFRAVCNASFLAISAFTNAGFDTYNNDLNLRLGSQHASQILTVIIMLLIFFGSLGMQVVRELPHVLAEFYRALASRRFSLRRFGMKISFNTKLILLTNIFLW